MKVEEALSAGQALGLERLDAQLLLLHSLGRSGTDRGWLLAHDDEELGAPALAACMALYHRRAVGEPLAYIVGHKEFHGIGLQVDARVLIPRPDTETLVDWAIELLREHAAPRVADLGTGSGAIALAIKRALPHAVVEASDSSGPALDVARDNARRLRLEVAFAQRSWLDGAQGRFDLIAANPPYVREGDPHLAALGREPAQALVGGADGLDAIRAIIAQAPAHLAAGGWLLLEHGWDQGPAVRALLSQPRFGWVATRRDLAGVERVTCAQALELG